jgi:endonuclease/exonuclease/phosphatase (EEP) superfamily protein YafD
VLRWVHADSWWLLVAATAISPWLYFSSWVIAAGAAWAHRPRLAAVAGILVVISIWWLAPQWYPFSRASTPASGSIPLRIFDANVEYSNLDLADIGAEIKAANPDVITLEELSYANEASLTATGVLSAYQWHYVIPDYGSYGFGVWSRIPLTDATTWYAGGHPEVRGWLQPPGGPKVRLYVVHTGAPRSGAVAEWHQEMTAIAANLKTEPAPLVVAGDFNATWDMYEFQHILHDGLRDTAVEQGRGWDMTWSRQMRVIPPLVRIDHVLYSRGITSTGYRVGQGTGSDHRPIIATLAVAPAT